MSQPSIFDLERPRLLEIWGTDGVPTSAKRELNAVEAMLNWPFGAETEVELRPSMITRNEADLLNLSFPRFAVRVYLPFRRGFINLRRVAPLTEALQGVIERKGSHSIPVGHRVTPIADCILTPPETTARRYHVLTSRLAEDYGENEVFPGTPFVRHMLLGGGLCAQACCWMITGLLRDHAAAIYGLSETTFLSSQQKQTEKLDLVGLDGGRITSFLNEHVGLNATFTHLSDQFETYTDGAADMLKICRMYIESGYPILLPVNAHLWSKVLRSITLSGERPFSKFKMASGSHSIVIVGVERDGGQHLLVNDPGSAPFIPVTAGKILDAQQDVDQSLVGSQAPRIYQVVPPEVQNHPTRFFSPQIEKPFMGIVEVLRETAGISQIPSLHFLEPTEVLCDRKDSHLLDIVALKRFAESLSDPASSAVKDHKRIWDSSTFHLIQVPRTNEGDLGSFTPFSDAYDRILRAQFGCFSDCEFVWVQQLEMQGTSEHGVSFEQSIWVWDATQAALSIESIPDVLDRKLFSNEVLEFSLRALRLVCTPTTALYQIRSSSISTRKGRGAKLPVNNLESPQISRALHPAVITSFATSAIELETSFPKSLARAELYVMMQYSAVEIANEFHRITGAWPRAAGGLTAFCAVDVMAAIMSDEALAGNRLIPQDQILARRQQLLRFSADRLLAFLPQDCKVSAIATFVPSISSAPDTSEANKAVLAVAFALLLANLLRQRGHCTQVVEIVAGAKIATPTWEKDTEGNERFWVRVKTDSEVHSHILSNIESTISTVIRAESELKWNACHRSALALELEPGPLFAFRDIHTWNQLARKIQSVPGSLLDNALGFNLDVGHLQIAQRQSSEASLLCTAAIERIVNCHVSGISRLGHLADLPLAATTLTGDADRILRLFLQSNSHSLSCSDSVSIELEATSNLAMVETSVTQLKNYLNRTAQ